MSCTALFCASGALAQDKTEAQVLREEVDRLKDTISAMESRLERMEAGDIAPSTQKPVSSSAGPLTSNVPAPGAEGQTAFDRVAEETFNKQVTALLDQLSKKHREAQQTLLAEGSNEANTSDVRANLALFDRLSDEHARYVRLRQEWLAAVAAWRVAEKRVAIATNGRGDGKTPPASDLSPLAADDRRRLLREQAAVEKTAKEIPPKYALYEAQRKALVALKAHAVQELSGKAPARVQVVGAEQQRQAKEDTRKERSCVMNTVEEMVKLDPNACRFDAEAFAGAAGRGTEGTISLPDRPVDRRGVTTQLTTSGDSATATLKLAGNIKFRKIPREPTLENFRQQNRRLSYSVGLTADVADSKRRIGGDKEGAKYPSALDRLDERLKGTASIGFNWFDRRGGATWQRDARNFLESATKACVTDQAKETAFPSTCTDAELTAWIFAESDAGGYRNPAEVQAFNSLYWGSDDSVARAGIGLTGEIARPSLDYYTFGTHEIADPLRPGKTKTVVDTAMIPPEFLTGDPESKRLWTYSIGAYGFYRFGETGPRDRAVTFIPSFTYKRAFEKPKKVTLCPGPAAGTPSTQVVTSELCEEISPNGGDIKHFVVPAIEARIHLPNRFLGQWLVPSVGIAPKISFEQDIDDDNTRYSFDMPIWFGLDTAGKLNGGLAFQRQWGGVKSSGAPKEGETSLSIFVSTTFDLGSK
ncbi:MAG TPA: hypothetical protein VF680_03010 [Allosphingosinicella sp.]